MRIFSKKLILFLFIKIVCEYSEDKKYFLPKLNTTKINDSIFGLQLSGNSPIEDKLTISEINLSSKSYFLSILDGHGGYELSDYANKIFLNYFNESYHSYPEYMVDEKKITLSLQNTFRRIEKEFLTIVLNQTSKGNKRYSYIGTCVLIGIINNNKLYIANLGDSKARLISINERINIYNSNSNRHVNRNYYSIKKLSKVFNARKQYEQIELTNKWPSEVDIFICHRNNPKACYVKGTLQPTRTLGDFHLKLKEFNKNNLLFNGPYISNKPEINIYKLNRNDKYLVLASDGLWDEIKSSELSKLIETYNKDENIDKKEEKNIENLSYYILYKILEIICENFNITIKKLMKISEGKYLRQIHDDISMIIVDIEKLLF